MATSSQKQYLTNQIISQYVPHNLKWFAKEGLNTWYLQGKCQDLLNDTDSYFQNVKVTNFDMIFNDLPDDTIKKYRTVNFEKINSCPNEHKTNIENSIFRHINCSNYNVEINQVKKHFTNKQKAVGRGRFLKHFKDTMHALNW